MNHENQKEKEMKGVGGGNEEDERGEGKMGEEEYGGG